VRVKVAAETPKRTASEMGKSFTRTVHHPSGEGIASPGSVRYLALYGRDMALLLGGGVTEPHFSQSDDRHLHPQGDQSLSGGGRFEAIADRGFREDLGFLCVGGDDREVGEVVFQAGSQGYRYRIHADRDPSLGG